MDDRTRTHQATLRPGQYVSTPDARGRVQAAEGWLSLRSGSDPTTERQPGYDRGHLIGRQFGGGGDSRNIVHMSPLIIRGWINRFEKQIADRVRNGEQLYMRVRVRYNDRTKLATHLVHEVYRRENGQVKLDTIHMVNPSGPLTRPMHRVTSRSNTKTNTPSAARAAGPTTASRPPAAPVTPLARPTPTPSAPPRPSMASPAPAAVAPPAAARSVTPAVVQLVANASYFRGQVDRPESLSPANRAWFETYRRALQSDPTVSTETARRLGLPADHPRVVAEGAARLTAYSNQEALNLINASVPGTIRQQLLRPDSPNTPADQRRVFGQFQTTGDRGARSPYFIDLTTAFRERWIDRTGKIINEAAVREALALPPGNRIDQVRLFELNGSTPAVVSRCAARYVPQADGGTQALKGGAEQIVVFDRTKMTDLSLIN